MELTIKDLFKKIKEVVKGDKRDFYDARKAYQMAKYNDSLTREQVKSKLLESLKRQVTLDVKQAHTFLNITIYDSYREKQLLPEIAEYFKELGYHVDLLRTGKYENTHVLIINWQDLEAY